MKKSKQYIGMVLIAAAFSFSSCSVESLQPTEQNASSHTQSMESTEAKGG